MRSPAHWTRRGLPRRRGLFSQELLQLLKAVTQQSGMQCIQQSIVEDVDIAHREETYISNMQKCTAFKGPVPVLPNYGARPPHLFSVRQVGLSVPATPQRTV